MELMGYTREDVENMATILNYTLHHHLTDTKFISEDKKVLEQIEDLLNGLLFEGRI
jgi:hypothetical protein